MRKSNNTAPSDEKDFLKIKSWRFLALVLCGAIVASGVAFAFYKSVNDYIDRKMYDQRTESVSSLAQRSAEVIETHVDAAGEHLDFLLMTLGEKYDKNTDVISFIRGVNDYIQDPDLSIVLIDSNGNYYVSSGDTGAYEDGVGRLLESAGARRMYMGPLSINSKRTNVLLCVETLKEPIAAKATTTTTTTEALITQCGIAHTIDSLMQYFNVGYNGYATSYVISSTGEIVFRNARLESLFGEKTFFETLDEGGLYNHVSKGKTMDAVMSGNASDGEYILDGQKITFATVPIADAGMSLLVATPSDGVAATADGAVNSMLTYLIVGGTFIIILGFAIILIVYRWYATNKLIKEKQSTNEALEEAVAAAEEASQAKTKFLSNMSHDIRTPINGIIGMTEIAMKEENLSPKVEDCLNKISGASQHLLSLINDVLDMSRIESGKTKILSEPMDVRVLVDNCSSIISGQLLNRKVDFIIEEIDIDYPHLFGDMLHLRQVMINIIGNAVKFTPDGGTIWFRIIQDVPRGDSVDITFEIEDTGMGMAPDFIPKIFEAFSQESEGSRTNYKGTGLGMAITKQFVDMMGGTIKVESELEKGSKFTVTVPFKIDFDAKDVKEEKVENADIDGVKILIVEDNALNLEIITELLEDEGAVISSVTDGKQAVEEFNSRPAGTYDLIFMDVMMPVMNGLDATRAIRALPREDAKTIPIIAMTANAFDEDIKATHEAGMNEHLTKPVVLEDVFKVLSKYYRKA